MTEIVTITLNPAVDYATSVEHVSPGPKLYCRSPRIDPGGGGVNVARAILKLGGAANAFVVVGGPTGDRLVTLLEAETVPIVPFRVSGETRYSLAVTDEATNDQFRFSLPGDPLSVSEVDQVLDKISHTVPQHGLVVLSGGMAQGMADDFPQKVQNVVAKANSRLIVDTSKTALQHLINSPVRPVDVLRLDRSELNKVVARPTRSIADNLAFGAQLVARGVARVVVTGHGAEGSVLVSEELKLFCHAPKVPVCSKIGAGDAFVGAFTLSLSGDDSLEAALRWGVAAAAATVGTEGTALFERNKTEALLAECQIERL